MPSIIFHNSLNIQQWYTELQTVQRVMDDLSNISVNTNDRTQLLNKDSLKAMTTAIQGLSKEQALLALSTKSLTGAQTNQILVEAGLMASAKHIKTSLVEEALLHTNLTSVKQKGILITANLLDANTLEYTAKKACTAAELKNVMVKQETSAANIEAAMAALNLSAANSTQAVSWNLLSKSILGTLKAFAASPVGVIAIAAAGIFTAKKAVDAFTISSEEAQEALQQSRSNYKQAASDLEALNIQLRDCQAKMQELESVHGIGNLVDNRDYQNLKDTNAELQRSIELKKIDQQMEAQKIAKSASDAYHATVKSDYADVVVSGGGASVLNNLRTPVQEMDEALKRYRADAEEYDRITEELSGKQIHLNGLEADSKEYKSLSKEIKSLQKDQTKLGQSMQTHSSRAKEMKDIISDTYNGYQDVLDSGLQLSEIETAEMKEAQNALDSYCEVYSTGLSNISSASDSASQDSKKTFNQLSVGYAYASGCLDNLTEANAEQITKELELQGVSNASAIVQEHLAAAKELTALTGWDLANITASEAAEFLNEASASDIARAYVAQLALAKAAVNGTKIDTSSDIQQLINLANTAGTSAEFLSKIERAKSLYENVENSKAVGSAGNLAMINEADQLMQDAFNNHLDFKPFDVSDFVSPPSLTPSSVKTPEKEPINFDWTAHTLDQLKAQRSQLEKAASDTYRAYTGLSISEIKRAEELLNTATPSPDTMNELIALAEKAGLSFSELQNRIQNGSGLESRQSFLEQTMALDKEIIQKSQIAADEARQAYKEALSQIPEDYQSMIEGGGEDIELLPPDIGEKVQEAARLYKESMDADSAVDEAKRTAKDTKEDYYSQSINQIDKENEALENQNALLNAQMDFLSASGSIIGGSLYQSLLSNTEAQIGLAQSRLKAAKAKMEDLDEDEDSEKYYELNAEIVQSEQNLLALQKAQEEYNKKLRELPIDNMDTVISMYDSITEAIQNWSSELEASGQKLDKTYYQTLINHGTEIIDQYDEQAGLIEEVMNEYETGSDNWNELYRRLQSVNSAMSSMVKNLYEWNEALLKLPLESLGTFSDELQRVSDALTDIQSDYDTVISTVTDSIQKEIDCLGEEKEVTEETYQKKIDLLQEQIDLMDKANEKRQMELAVEQALYDLEKAKGQKTNRVIRDGKISYEADAEQIRSAEETLTDAREDMEKYGLQKQLEGLQDELDSVNDIYDGQIEKLEEMAEKWGDIKTNVEEAHDSALTEQYLGAGWMEQILSGNDSGIFSNFKSMYETLDKQLTDYEEQISSTENIYSLLEDYITSYQEGKVTYEQAMAAINHLLSQMNEKLTANGNLQNILDYVGVSFGNSTGKTPEAILDTLKDSFKDTGDELLASLAQYNENAGMITEYTSSWEQLTDNVASMKDILEEVRDNLDDTLDEISQLRDDYEEEDEEDDDVHYTTDGDTSPRHDKDDWGSDTEGPGAGLSYAPKYFADGIHNGAIGKNSPSEHVSLLKLLATQKLHPDEVPIIAHRGEVVLNPEQQAMILKNVSPLYNPFSGISIPDYPFLAAKRELPQVIVNLGGVTMHEVSSCDAFAKELGDTFGIKMRQQVSKYLP